VARRCFGMASRGVYVTVTSSICCPASAGALAAWAGTAANQMFLHATRSTEPFFLSEREPRANNALAAASRVVQMNSTMLFLGRAGAR
jgi:hypothetical protein